ncbi:MAG: CPBP family intramembrane glutamic endopeptidase [Planctomycetota bacterium]
MLALADALVQALVYGPLALGTLLLLGAVAHLIRSGRWRNPLAGYRLDAHGPSFAAVGATLLFYFVTLLALASALLPKAEPGRSELAPGSDRWNRSQLAHTLTNAAAAVVMTVILVQSRRPPPGWRAMTWGSGEGGPASTGGPTDHSALLTASTPECPVAETSPPRHSPPALRDERDARGPGRRLASLGGGVLAAIVGLLMFLPVIELQLRMGMELWTWINPDAPPPMHEVLRALLANEWGARGVALLTLGAVVVSPIAEELFFRGMLLQALAWHLGLMWPAILISGAAFGVVHYAQPQDVLPLVTMGAALGYLRVRTGALWPCILLHSLFNARTVLRALLAAELVETSMT